MFGIKRREKRETTAVRTGSLRYKAKEAYGQAKERAKVEWEKDKPIIKAKAAEGAKKGWESFKTWFNKPLTTGKKRTKRATKRRHTTTKGKKGKGKRRVCIWV